MHYKIEGKFGILIFKLHTDSIHVFKVLRWHEVGNVQGMFNVITGHGKYLNNIMHTMALNYSTFSLNYF